MKKLLILSSLILTPLFWQTSKAHDCLDHISSFLPNRPDASLSKFIATLRKAGFTAQEIEMTVNGLSKIYSPRKTLENIEWLKSHGVEDIGKVVSSKPAILGYSIEDNLNPKLEWLKSLGVDVDKVMKLNPGALGYSLEENLIPKINWLNEQGIDSAKAISAFPAILGASIEDNLNPKMQWLKLQGVKDPAKTINAFPSFFSLSIEDNLNPKVQWLKDQGVKNVGKIISLYPLFFKSSLEKTLIPKTEWLRGLGVKKIGKCIESAPVILRYSINDNLNPKIDWLKEIGVKDIPHFIESFPMILGYSIDDNLNPTIIELTTHWGLTIEDIERGPGILMASLGRIQDLRNFLNTIAQMNRDSFFNLAHLPLPTKKYAISSVSPKIVLENLKSTGVIRKDVSSLLELNEFEQKKIIALYRTGLFLKLLVPLKQLSSSAKNDIATFCESLFLL